MATKTSKPKPRTKPEARGCECFAVEQDVTDEGEIIFGACGHTTVRRFAPGHDAKLKGALIKAAIGGHEFHQQKGGMLVSVDPRILAKELGWAGFIDGAVDRHQRRLRATQARAAQAEQRRAEREADRAAKAEARAAAKAEAKPQPKAGAQFVRVKIGRAVYDAAVQAESANELTVAYKDRKGNSKTATVKRSSLVLD